MPGRGINVACQAGTEGNLQPTRWIVVRSEAAKRHLEAAISIEVPLTSAPVILICLADALAWKLAPQRLQEMVATGKITEEKGREVLRQVQSITRHRRGRTTHGPRQRSGGGAAGPAERRDPVICRLSG